MKTLQECKDEVAKKHYNRSWREIYLLEGFPTLIRLLEEAAELYASQPRSLPSNGKTELTDEEIKALSSVGIIAKNWYAVTYNENQTPWAMFDDEERAQVYRDQFSRTSVIVPYPMQIKDYRKGNRSLSQEQEQKTVEQLMEPYIWKDNSGVPHISIMDAITVALRYKVQFDKEIESKLKEAEQRYEQAIERNIDNRERIDELTQEIERLKKENEEIKGEVLSYLNAENPDAIRVRELESQLKQAKEWLKRKNTK